MTFGGSMKGHLRGEVHTTCSETARVRILAPLLTGCVTSTKLLNSVCLSFYICAIEMIIVIFRYFHVHYLT